MSFIVNEESLSLAGKGFKETEEELKSEVLVEIDRYFSNIKKLSELGYVFLNQ